MNRLPRLVKVCPTCGDLFEVRSSDMRQFCSLHCRPGGMLGRHHTLASRRKASRTRLRLFRERKIQIAFKGQQTGKYLRCRGCDREVYVYPYRLKAWRYCSRACTNACRDPHSFPYGNAQKGFAAFRGRKIYCQSSWEMSFVRACSRAPFVRYFSRPNGCICYRDIDNQRHKYHPDFVVGLTNGFGFIVEIKPDFAQREPKTVRKLSTAKLMFGKEFLIVSEKVKSVSRLRVVLKAA